MNVSMVVWKLQFFWSRDLPDGYTVILGFGGIFFFFFMLMRSSQGHYKLKTWSDVGHKLCMCIVYAPLHLLQGNLKLLGSKGHTTAWIYHSKKAQRLLLPFLLFPVLDSSFTSQFSWKCCQIQKFVPTELVVKFLTVCLFLVSILLDAASSQTLLHVSLSPYFYTLSFILTFCLMGAMNGKLDILVLYYCL